MYTEEFEEFKECFTEPTEAELIEDGEKRKGAIG